MARVLICEDRRIVREGLARAMSAMVGMDSVEGVTNADELLVRYAPKRLDLVLIGTRRAFPVGVQATRRLVAAYPDANVIAFGGPEDANCIAAAIAVGARGYLRWDAAQSEPSTVTRTLAHALTANVVVPVPPRAPRDLGPQQLTERELQVLRAMSQGRTNGQIGQELFLSEDTIKTHARRIFRKLGVKDRAEAVAHGFRHGLVC